MKIIKKSLLTLALLTAYSQIFSDNFGGGFAAGALTGVALTGIATAASRQPADPVATAQSRQYNAASRRLDRANKEQNMLDKKINNQKISQEEYNRQSALIQKRMENARKDMEAAG